MAAWKTSTLTPQPVGANVLLGGRLWPLAACIDPVRRSATVAAFTPMILSADVELILLGSKISAFDRNSALTSVTPAFRTSVLHVMIASDVAWANTTTYTLLETERQRDLVHTKTKALDEVWPDSGAYFNEADVQQELWGTAFWGTSNYQKLV